MWAAACSSCAAIASSSARAIPVLESRPLFLKKKRCQKKRFRCSSTRSEEDEDQTDTPRPLKVAVSVVTELLRALRSASQPLDRVDNACNASNESLVRGVDDVLAILRLDYEQSYFLTGNFTSAIYADDCLFEDPTIKFQGKELYSQNLELLVPFFDQPSLMLKLIEKGVNDEREFVVATWSLRAMIELILYRWAWATQMIGSAVAALNILMLNLRCTCLFVNSLNSTNKSRILRTSLKLPWRPLISIEGSTIYELDEEFKIIRHKESWNVAAFQAILQILTPGFGKMPDG